MARVSITWNTVLSGLEELLQHKLIFMRKIKEIIFMQLQIKLSEIKNLKLLNKKRFSIFTFLLGWHLSLTNVNT